MEFKACLPGCAPTQIVNFTLAINDISNICITNNCGCPYDVSQLQYAYSIDNVCWTCYMDYDTALSNTVGLNTDFYIRVKVPGTIKGITVNNEIWVNYSTSLDSVFQITSCNSDINPNQWNPYKNLDCAMQLYSSLVNSVSCMIGIDVYYIKLNGVAGSKDLTFKEYALLGVQDIKQIKLIVTDGQMPSSKSTINEFGWDWEVDWETEISKAMFATAFGNTAQPMEGDLIYIPMMKRMWMVNEAYEEKRDGFMWNAMTFKLALVKYQEKGSVDLGEVEDFVNGAVKNKYDDLFGENENVGAQSEAVDAPSYAANGLYPVYRSDATRKLMSCDNIDYINESIHHKNVLISDMRYTFVGHSTIVYQKQYCGTDGTLSFIMKPDFSKEDSGELLSIGHIKVMYEQIQNQITLTLLQNNKVTLTIARNSDINDNNIWFVFLRWSKSLNIIEMSMAKLCLPDGLPIYRAQPFHYYFDIDNRLSVVGKWDMEMIVENKSEVILRNIQGQMTNFKLFETYNDNISEILQMYPTHQHLLINDTARKVVDGNGVMIQ